MSKASRYAERVKAAKDAPLDFFWREDEGSYARYGRVSITDDGWLWTPHCHLSPEQALKLADWIYANFGEEDV